MKNWISLIAGMLLWSLTTSTEARQYYEPSAANAVAVTVIDEHGYRLPLYDVAGGNRLKKSYLEVLRGQQYSIEVRNRTNRRVGFVIAVDGRNIINGKKSYLTSNERMYILAPHQVSTFRGWRSSRNTINRFYFTREMDSYAGAFGDYSAMGVIAVAAFFEKQQHPPHVYGNRGSNKGYDDSASARANPGTGWGETEHSPTRTVRFVAQNTPFAKHLIKYEWHKTLCQMGIIECYRHQHRSNHPNRLWSDDGFAPAPPRLSISRG